MAGVMATLGKLLLAANSLAGLLLFNHVHDELPLRLRFSARGVLDRVCS